MTKNTIQHNYSISKAHRNRLIGHNSMLIWFTGLSGSGKSTIANLLEEALHADGVKTFSLDGDNIRKGLNKDLGFKPKDRTENIRRIAEVANLFIESGTVVLAAFVSPYKKDRENIRNIVNEINFVEVFINTSLEECERRDVKGLYEKARSGEIQNMTGIDAPYEAPDNPDIEIRTEEMTKEEAVNIIRKKIRSKLKLKDE